MNVSSVDIDIDLKTLIDDYKESKYTIRRKKSFISGYKDMILIEEIAQNEERERASSVGFQSYQRG